jgi:hypothetical protein
MLHYKVSVYYVSGVSVLCVREGEEKDRGRSCDGCWMDELVRGAVSVVSVVLVSSSVRVVGLESKC